VVEYRWFVLEATTLRSCVGTSVPSTISTASEPCQRVTGARASSAPGGPPPCRPRTSRARTAGRRAAASGWCGSTPRPTTPGRPAADPSGGQCRSAHHRAITPPTPACRTAAPTDR
jgi:hypothetical protein